MNILLVNKAYFPHIGGVETAARQVAAGMRRRGHETAALCFGELEAAELVDGVRVRRVRPAWRVGSAPVGLRFVREFFRLSSQADVINFHSPNPMGELALLLAHSFLRKKNKRCRIVCTYQGDAQRPKFLLPAYDALLRRFFGKCDVIAVSSPPLARNSRVLQANLIKEKIRVVPLGVRTENYERHAAADLEAARRLLPLPPDSFKVMYAGRLVYYKGLEVLLGALKKLKDLDARRPVSAFLVGSGPEENFVRASIAELQGSAILIPHQPEGVYRALFSLADCFVLPSTHKTEAYGIVLAEAMASGLPLISTELGTGTSWLNRDGETGIVVPPRDPEALALAIARLAGDEEGRARMASASRARAKNFFEEQTMLDEYEKIFQVFSPVFLDFSDFPEPLDPGLRAAKPRGE